MDVASESDLYEIPPPTFVPPLPPVSEKERQTTVSQLHLEVEKFSKMLEMDEKELRRKRELIKM